jgi:hypothetical protein
LLDEGSEDAMIRRTLTLEEFKQSSLEAVLTEELALTVRLPDGEGVTIAPKPHLEPLPELEGCVPKGWKDAVYERS